MPGRVGGVWRTQLGVKLMRINTKLNILYLKGPVLPG